MEDHVDVGRRILAAAGITPKDYSDVYDQMEFLGYFRVIEFPQRIFAENSNRLATVNQMAFLRDRQFADGVVRELLLNNELFTETRREGSLTHEKLEEICDADGRVKPSG